MQNIDLLIKYYINKSYENKLKIRKQIQYFQLYVTNKCSEQCLHCYLKNNTSNEMNLSEIFKQIDIFILDCIKNKKIPIIDLIGGDPFLRLDIKEILLYLLKKKIKFGIKGNPYFIKKFKDLIKNNISFYQLSLDGMEKTHDFYRSKGSFNSTINAIRLLNELNIPVFIKFTLNQENEKELWTLLNYLYKNNLLIKSFSISRYYSEDFTHSSFNSKELENHFNNFIKIFIDFYTMQILKKQIKIHINLKEHLWYPYLHKNGFIFDEIHEKISKAKYGISCSLLSSNSTFLKSDGKFILCPKIPCKKDIYDLEVFNEYKSKFLKNILRKNCNGCFYKTVCLGCIAFSKQNNLNNIDFGCFLYTKYN